MSVQVRAEAYKRKTLLEHILLRAETYVGSKEPEVVALYIPEMDQRRIHMTLKDVNFVPAFYKIFDEIIVNAADNKVRDPSMNMIKVTIDPERARISVWNNGKGIPVVYKETEKLYVPEMIFGHLLTGSNYDDDEKRVTGGRNGYGAKLTNIFSKEFQIETHDTTENKIYKQKWSDNMSKCSPPRITKSTSKKGDYTKIMFEPDLHELNMPNGIDADTFDVLKKRVYDLTGSLSGVKVYLNGDRINVSSFKDYISTFLVNENEEKPKFIYERINDRWEIAIAASDTGGFQHVSFVNSIATIRGGTHVNYVTDQIVAYIKEVLEKKDSSIVVKPAQIKNQLFVFVNCLIENPTFEGQLKETLALRPNKYGSTCVLPDNVLKKIGKLGIVETLLEMIHEKNMTKLKKTDGQKRSRLTGIVKLHDANDAGTKKSKHCTLMITEGDSALSFALTGIRVLKNGQDSYGAFPLRGKLLNVRDASTKQKLDNKEIAQLKQIIGLQEGKVYGSTESLRYGHICILTDADHDGKHIKGLILNWLETSFPSLLKLPDFVLDFHSPIVKCTKGRQEHLFFNLHDYEQWKIQNSGSHGWNIKYYKGLGTSKKEDVQKYFSSIDRHLKRFREIDERDAEKLDLIFSKKRANDRKRWLERYDPNIVSQGIAEKNISINEFIDKEFIEFSMYDNVRSIPSVVDGLKPGQRKIMFTAFKTKLNSDVKVAQFASKVAEMTEYRHGESSLCETIIGMAQDFVGSNNINLLAPEGQFGTRRMGGKDAAQPRYTYTKLRSITRVIFHPEDDAILDYLEEDNIRIEPRYYVPVIPMVLVNGAEGIGSAYSTTILNYDPKELISLLRRRTCSDDTMFQTHLTPWYKGFKGRVQNLVGNDGVEVHKWIFSGNIQKGKSPNTLDVTELPIHLWTEKYKEFLEDRILAGQLKDYKEYHTDTSEHFVIKCNPEYYERIQSCSNLEKEFKLVTQKYTSNMMLFSPEGKLKHYKNVGEILEEFYTVRMEYYKKRKDRLIDDILFEKKWADNRARFIQAIVEEQVVINKRSKKELIVDLANASYDTKDDSYDYLLNMPLHNLTQEKIKEIVDHTKKLEVRFKQISNTTLEEMYRKDLDDVEKHLV
jgi:DNA topoisomerase II